MQGLSIEYARKIAVQKYRAKSRDVWGDNEWHNFEQQQHKEHMESGLPVTSVLDEYLYSQQHQVLSTATVKTGQMLIDYSADQCELLDRMYASAENATTTPVEPVGYDTK